jgi:DNA-directed RNA polymerase specialized sigma24 family protein
LELNVQEREELDALRAALSQLSEEQQTILLLRFVERKSTRSAQILEKSVRAIATAQHRALKSLAEILGTAKTSRHYLRGKST